MECEALASLWYRPEAGPVSAAGAADTWPTELVPQEERWEESHNAIRLAGNRPGPFGYLCLTQQAPQA